MADNKNQTKPYLVVIQMAYVTLFLILACLFGVQAFSNSMPLCTFPQLTPQNGQISTVVDYDVTKRY